MKKQLLIIAVLMGATLTATAQLKVHQNGYVSIQNNNLSSSSPLSIGTVGNIDYSISCNAISKSGMNLYVNSAGNSTPSDHLFGINVWNYGNALKNTGVKSVAVIPAQTNSMTPSGIGVNGIGRLGTNATGVVYGVLGNISGTRGVGVCGVSTLDGSNSYVDDSYAGLFIGKTKVVGNVIVTGTVSGMMLNTALPENAEQVESIQSDRSLVLEKLSEIDALSYCNAREAEVKFKENRDKEMEEDFEAYPGLKEMLGNSRTMLPEKDVLKEQIMRKKHYALSVEQLEKVFPDLVYEDNHGTKQVNYVEMIPLLVQSINELQSQVNELRGLDDKARMAPKRSASSGNDEASDISTPKLQNVKLYQNTPNPFTERTEIRFTLPDDAQNAYIYIFDMQGKMLRQIPVDASMQSVTINGYELSAGIYLYSLAVNGQEIDTKRMILSK